MLTGMQHWNLHLAMLSEIMSGIACRQTNLPSRASTTMGIPKVTTCASKVGTAVSNRESIASNSTADVHVVKQFCGN